VPARRPQKKESAWLADHTTVPELSDKNIEKMNQEESAIQVKSKPDAVTPVKTSPKRAKSV